VKRASASARLVFVTRTAAPPAPLGNGVVGTVFLAPKDGVTLLPNIPKGAFDEYRRDNEFRAEIAAIRARGEKLPTELPSSLRLCICNVTFDSHLLAQNLVHAPHIYAAQSKGLHR
jgi:hypothetical protein